MGDLEQIMCLLFIHVCSKHMRLMCIRLQYFTMSHCVLCAILAAVMAEDDEIRMIRTSVDGGVEKVAADLKEYIKQWDK